MRESSKRSDPGGRSWLDRIVVAWMIQISVIVWIAVGAVGQMSKQCSLEKVRVACRTNNGDINLGIPTWLNH